MHRQHSKSETLLIFDTLQQLQLFQLSLAYVGIRSSENMAAELQSRVLTPNTMKQIYLHCESIES